MVCEVKLVSGMDDLMSLVLPYFFPFLGPWFLLKMHKWALYCNADTTRLEAASRDYGATGL